MTQEEFNKASIEYQKKKREQSLALKIVLGAIVGLIFIIVLISALSEGSTLETSPQVASAQAQKASNVGVGDVMTTEIFEVTVNSVSVNDRVRTGNPFADLPLEKGNKYLILNTTFKNIDTESRMIIDGSVYIHYNGKEYEYDHSEPVMMEGWGILLDQINPLTSKTTNIVYKIPAEINGPVFYEPGRNYNNKRIALGNI